MTVRFCLQMKNAVIADLIVDYFELRWQEELSAYQLADRFNVWLRDEAFIEKRLPDIREAAFCQLTINPA